MKRKGLLLFLVALALSGVGGWFFYPRPKPLYCLLVFGPEERTRVWVVWRGDTAYLHRDGELARPGERMACESGDWASANLPGRWSRFSTAVESVEEVATYQVHFVKGSATDDPKGERHMAVYAQAPAGYTLMDGAGEQELGDDPATAPVVPIGPLEIALENPKARLSCLVLGGKENELRIWIGTFGRAKDPPAFALLSHTRGGVPEDVHPIADVEFPNATPGGPVVRARYVLDKRC